MAASLLTLGVLLAGGHTVLAQQPIVPAFTSPYGPKPTPAPAPAAAPAPALPPLQSEAGALHFTKDSQAAPAEAPLTFTKEASTPTAPESLSFTKEASTPAPAPVVKEIKEAPLAPAPVVVKPTPAPVVVAPPLPQAPLPSPVVTLPPSSPVSPYAVKPTAPAPLPAVAAKPLPVAPTTTLAAPSSILRTAAMQQPPKLPGDKALGGDESQEYFVQLEPPGPQRLFRLESEQSLHERMRQEALQRPSPDRIEFPTYKPLSDTPFVARDWPQQTEYAEASYVCYGRLFFEELNAERYGWDLGVIAPFVSQLYFYKDLALLPYHMGTNPFCCFDCSAGFCLPGDSVPYLCYPPKLNVPGTVAEAGAVLALMAIFP